MKNRILPVLLVILAFTLSLNAKVVNLQDARQAAKMPFLKGLSIFSPLISQKSIFQKPGLKN